VVAQQVELHSSCENPRTHTMPNWSYLIARLISAVGSWLDASNLRNRVYALEQQNELLRVALDDIARMDPEGRIGWYAQQAIARADSRE